VVPPAFAHLLAARRFVLTLSALLACPHLSAPRRFEIFVGVRAVLLRLLACPEGQLCMAADPTSVAALLGVLTAARRDENAEGLKTSDLVDSSVCATDPSICSPQHLHRLVSQHMTALQALDRLMNAGGRDDEVGTSLYNLHSLVLTEVGRHAVVCCLRLPQGLNALVGLLETDLDVRSTAMQYAASLLLVVVQSEHSLPYTVQYSLRIHQAVKLLSQKESLPSELKGRIKEILEWLAELHSLCSNADEGFTRIDVRQLASCFRFLAAAVKLRDGKLTREVTEALSRILESDVLAGGEKCDILKVVSEVVRLLDPNTSRTADASRAYCPLC
jgi:hypothetical protein